MKHLILVRHAKSSWDDISLRDIERPLNKRGKRDAPFMSKILKEKVSDIDLFLVSPAVRAQKTAKKFFEHYPEANWLTEEDIYEASTEALESIIYSIPDNVNTAIMFGHNPSFTFLANQFTDDYFDNLPTCGIAIIQFDGDHWTDIHATNARLKELLYPKMF